MGKVKRGQWLPSSCAKNQPVGVMPAWLKWHPPAALGAQKVTRGEHRVTRDRGQELGGCGVHTATTGRWPVRRHSRTRRFVHTTANGLRPFGSFRYLAGLSPISLSRTAALSADRSVENSRRAVAAVIPLSNSRWKASCTWPMWSSRSSTPSTSLRKYSRMWPWYMRRALSRSRALVSTQVSSHSATVYTPSRRSPSTGTLSRSRASAAASHVR